MIQNGQYQAAEGSIVCSVMQSRAGEVQGKGRGASKHVSSPPPNTNHQQGLRTTVPRILSEKGGEGKETLYLKLFYPNHISRDTSLMEYFDCP